MKRIVLGAVIALSAVAAAGAGSPPSGEVILKGSEVRAQLGPDYSNATLSISGPNGFYVSAFSKAGAVSINLIKAGATAEGEYSYELTAASSEIRKVAKPMDNGRGGLDPADEKVPYATKGQFLASGGIINDTPRASDE